MLPRISTSTPPQSLSSLCCIPKLLPQCKASQQSMQPEVKILSRGRSQRVGISIHTTLRSMLRLSIRHSCVSLQLTPAILTHAFITTHRSVLLFSSESSTCSLDACRKFLDAKMKILRADKPLRHLAKMIPQLGAHLTPQHLSLATTSHPRADGGALKTLVSIHLQAWKD